MTAASTALSRLLAVASLARAAVAPHEILFVVMSTTNTLKNPFFNWESRALPAHRTCQLFTIHAHTNRSQLVRVWGGAPAAPAAICNYVCISHPTTSTTRDHSLPPPTRTRCSGCEHSSTRAYVCSLAHYPAASCEL